MSTENTNTEIITDNDPLVGMLMETLPGQTAAPVQSTEEVTPASVEVKTDEVPANTETVNPETKTEEVVDTNTSPADEKPAFDVNAYFEQSSEGYVKSEDDYKSVIAKAKEHESLSKKIAELETEKENIFANEHIRTLNRLHKEGKSDEQISEYMKLSKLDIGKLDDKEVLIQREIANGYTRFNAEKVVERKYGLDKLSKDEDSLTAEELATHKEEMDFITESMRVDAAPLRDKMQEDFKSLSTEPSASEKAINEVAAQKAYRAKLEPFAESIMQKFPKNLTIGDDSTGIFNYDVQEDFISGLKDQAIDYFMDIEVNEENVEEFMVQAKKTWLYNNAKEIITSIKASAKAEAIKEAREEYVNPQGLPKPAEVPVIQAQDLDSQLMNIAADN